MFGNLKKKLQSLLGKKDSEEEISPKKEAHKEKKSKTEKNTKKGREEKKEETIEKKLKKKADKITEEVPVKFETGKLKYEPDEEEIKKKETPLEELSVELENKTEEESFFKRISKKFTTQTLSQEQIDEIFEPLELVLLENNVALEVVDKIRENLSKDLAGIEVKKSEDLQKLISTSLKESISSVLIEPPDLISQIKKKADIYTIVFFGINGSGKTTSLAKLASLLKKEKISCVLAAGDTFRAASIEQLQKHADSLGIPLIKSQYGSDPTSVAFDAQQYARKNKIQCVLVDTAGRMYTKSNLIKEMEKLIRVIKPDLKIFVGESITGNDAVEQAKTFNEAIGIDGIILTKADVDEKGGTALSVSQITNKPIYFLGTGQSYSDFEIFKKKNILDKLGL